jgi:hypothetical protein
MRADEQAAEQTKWAASLRALAELRLVTAGFLARYSEPTRASYHCDLRQFFA